MERLVKKYLIPQEHNDYKPHLLRRNASLVLIVLTVLIEITLLSRLYIVQPGANFLAYIVPNVLVDLTNSNRQSDALPQLKLNFLLQAAANLKAGDMARKGYFAHVSPDGSTPWYWFQKVGYNYAAAGENLAVNFTDSEDVVRAWMNSEGHRKNILNQKYTETGIGIATGEYQGMATTFIVQLFGRPMAIAPPKVTPQALPATPIALVTPPKPLATTPKPLAVQEQAVKSAEMFTEKTNQTDLAGLMTSTESGVSNSVESLVLNNSALVLQPKESNFVMRLFTMPKAFANYAYLILLGLVLLALALKLLIRGKSRLQHPALLLNGLIVILMILSLMDVNKYLLISTLQIF